MVRNQKKYTLALELRKNGTSIRTIARSLSISTSTASVWCRDIILSHSQTDILKKKSQNTALLRALAEKRHLDKLEKHRRIISESQKIVGSLSSRDKFIAGISLYWAEGFKNINEGRIGFCNSDPQMVLFMISWFRDSFGLVTSDFVLRAEFNIAHVDRKDEIEEYWSQLTGIPLSQFNQPFLQRSIQVRDYSKRGTYYGVLRIRIRKSSDLLVKIRGFIKALSLDK